MRWLLMTQDRVGKEEFVLTQEFLAEMLAVRRQTVTVFTGTRQTAGFITYRRGNMRILNREAPSLPRLARLIRYQRSGMAFNHRLTGSSTSRSRGVVGRIVNPSCTPLARS